MVQSKCHFKFTKQERSGIFFLLFLLVFVQVYYFLYQNTYVNKNFVLINEGEQAKVDTLKLRKLQKKTHKLYPFNPNFITDYKGYVLGMSIEQIDCLHAFRAKNKYVKTALEFQKVTSISDTLLSKIAPYFKFPTWVAKTNVQKENTVNVDYSYAKTIVKDLNTATAEDLKKVYGIGKKLSVRIIKFRDRLGGFLVADQLRDVYGLKPEVVTAILKKFKIISIPSIERINLNTATVNELASIVYIKRSVAYDIIEYKYSNGEFKSIEELLEIEDFPTNRINRLALYLYVKN